MGSKRKQPKTLCTVNVTREIHKRLALIAIHKGVTIGNLVASLALSLEVPRGIK